MPSQNNCLVTQLLFLNDASTLRINETEHNNALPLCLVLCFICCYAEGYFTECRYAECHYGECLNAEYHHVEFRYAVSL